MKLVDYLDTVEGMSRQDAQTATAVMLAESGGRWNAINRNVRTPEGTVEDMIGGFQISTMHLRDGGLLAGWTRAKLQDPKWNIKAFLIIKAAQGWGAWEAFTNGAYRKHMGNPGPDINLRDGGPTADVTGAVAGAVGSVGDTVLGPLDEIAGGVGEALKFLADPGSWFPVAKVALGGALIIIGTAAIVFAVASKAGGTPIGKAFT